ncbi:MAG: fimbrillin family protein [Bacteroidales bacterium]|nr:fimbrillin family protein [Bacteroidales bacterium]
MKGSCLYIAALFFAAMLASACQRERLPAGEPPIRFSSAVATKASDMPDTKDYLFREGAQIGVYGTWISTEGESFDVFSNIKVTCHDTEDDSDPAARYEWSYYPLRYWRKNGKYYFRGIYPADANIQFGSDGTKVVASYSMFADNYDFMVASAERDMAGVDGLYPADYTAAVPLTFKHALSAVRFIFKKGTEDVNRHYYLNSFEVEYIRSVGVLVYDGDASGSGGAVLNVDSWNAAEFRSPSVLTWTASEEQDRIDVPQEYEDFKTLDHPSWVKWHFVIPQNLNAGDGYHPAVKFGVYVNQYDTDDTTLIYSSGTPVETTLLIPETYTDDDGVHDVVWEPGKVYTYFIQIQAGQASITVNVADWDSYYLAVDDMVFVD